MFARIVSDPAILAGKPCVKGTRISVEMILECVASGASRNDIVKSYPQLKIEDVEEALNFAAQSANPSLEELLQRVTDDNLHGEWRTGAAVGAEIW